jgi:hypothetical protein
VVFVGVRREGGLVKKVSKNGVTSQVQDKNKRTSRVQPKKESEFLAVLRETGGNVSRACAAIELTRARAYEWRRVDPVFALAWDEAVELGTDELEEEARRRAFAGVDEPVFYQGEECGAVRKYSDTLLIFLLKGRRPDKYRERVTIDVNKLDADIERELAFITSGSQTSVIGETEGESVH